MFIYARIIMSLSYLGNLRKLSDGYAVMPTHLDILYIWGKGRREKLHRLKTHNCEIQSWKHHFVGV